MSVNSEEIKNITIFIHGTHTQLLTALLPKTLYIPWKLVNVADLNKHNYIKWLATSISSSNNVCYPLDNFYVFGWSGALSSHERFKAAQTLYCEIQHLINSFELQHIKTRITIVTHSHGGNIALNLAIVYDNDVINKFYPASRVDFVPAKYVSKDTLHIHKLIMLACPVTKETEDLVDHKIFKNIYSIYSKADMFQVLSLQGLPNLKKKPVFSGRRFKKVDTLKQFAIRINGRSIMHVEFIFWKFPKILSGIVERIDNLSDNGEYNMHVHYKNHKIHKIDLDKFN